MPSPFYSQKGGKDLWDISKIWKNERVYVLGNGPGLGVLENNNCLKGKNVLAVNSAVEIGDYVGVVFFGDARWYWNHKKKLQNFKGLVITTNIHVPGLYETVENESNIKIVGMAKFGISRKENTVAFNGSSGGAAVDLAVHLGAKEIILIGYDMRLIDGRKNFFINLDSFIRVGKLKEEEHKKRKDPTAQFRQERCWKRIYDIAREKEIKILNTTPESILPCIPKVELKKVL